MASLPFRCQNSVHDNVRNILCLRESPLARFTTLTMKPEGVTYKGVGGRNKLWDVNL